MCDKVSASVSAMPAIVKLEKNPATKGRTLDDMAGPWTKEEFDASFAGFGDEWRDIQARILKAEQKEKDTYKKPPSYENRRRTSANSYSGHTTLAIQTHITPRNYWSAGPPRVKPTVTYQTGVREADANGTQDVYPIQG